MPENQLKIHVLQFVLIIVITFCRETPVHAQLPWENYEIISTQQGLPNTTVQALLQDSRGLIWIGTYNGLCVHNGNQLKTYKNAFGEITSTNWFHAIEVLFEDSHSNVWIGSRGGLISCFVRNEQAFRQYNRYNEKRSKINCFCEDKNGNIWTGDEDGRLTCVTNDSNIGVRISSKPILAISGRGADTIVVMTRDSLYAYLPEARTIVTLMEFERLDMITAGSNYQHYLLAYRNGVSIIDVNKLEIVREIPYPDNLLPTNNNQFIFSRYGGYYYMDAFTINEYDATGKLINSFNFSDNVLFYKNQLINCLIEDKSGILWVGTSSGLFKVDKNKYRFRKYSSNNIKGKMTDNYVRCIYADGNDNLWVGFKNGRINLMRFDKNEGRYLFEKDFPLVNGANSTLSSYTVNTVIRLHDGNVLVGGETGLSILNKKSGIFVPFMKELIPASLDGIWTLYEDKQANIWIGSHIHGLFIINKSRNKIYNYKKGNGKASLPDNDVWNIYEDKAGKIWLGTGRGLVEVVSGDDISKPEFRIYPLKKGKGVSVWSLADDAYGNLWIGTTGYGIFKMDKYRKRLFSYGNKPDLVISGIVTDTLGNTWISTVNGLYKYTDNNHQLTSFNENDGLISSGFNFKSSAYAPNGEIFFGSKIGMVSFFPENINSNSFGNTDVLITSVDIAGTDTTKVYYTDKPVRLSHKQNFITISFSLPEFSHPTKHRYRYRLAGFDSKWNYTDNSNPRAVYTNIPPGRYTFMVAASPDGIQWNGKTATLGFNIRPALWQNPVFRLLAVVASLLLLALLLYRRVRARILKERARHHIDQQIAELELKALQAQMNPHFVFNTINSIQHFILHKDELTAYDYLSKFAQLMRLYLESSKNKFISLENESELLHLYLSLEKLRFDNKFDFEITIDPGLNKNEIMIPSMLLQPFAENAIKHGLANKPQDGFLKITIISCGSNNAALKCIIDDNGIGRKKAAEFNTHKKHISRGIEMIQDRIKTYNFINEDNIDLNITDKQPPEEGTTVEITIPIPPVNL